MAQRTWTPDAGIHIFGGENGSGKTMVAFERCVLPVLKLGFPVVSNVTVKTEVLGLPRDDYYVPIEDWNDIVRVGTVPNSITGGRPCVVFIDEGSVALPARAYQQTPALLLETLDMFRHHDALVVVSVPNFFKLEKALRGTTQRVTHCVGTHPDRWLRDSNLQHVKDERGKKVPITGKQLWPSNTRFWTADFFPELYEKAVAGEAEWEPLAIAKYRLTKMVAPHVVDTHEMVGRLNHQDNGMCVHCGGRLPTQYCKCNKGPTSTKTTRGAHNVLQAT